MLKKTKKVDDIVEDKSYFNEVVWLELTERLGDEEVKKTNVNNASQDLCHEENGKNALVAGRGDGVEKLRLFAF